MSQFQEQLSQAIINGFDQLGGDPDQAISAAKGMSVKQWINRQKAQVTASGAGSNLVPGAHMAALAADMAFLMHKMAVTCWGIGAIQGCRVYGKPDFVNILDVWTGTSVKHLEYVAVSTSCAEFIERVTTRKTFLQDFDAGDDLATAYVLANEVYRIFKEDTSLFQDVQSLTPEELEAFDMPSMEELNTLLNGSEGIVETDLENTSNDTTEDKPQIVSATEEEYSDDEIKPTEFIMTPGEHEINRAIENSNIDEIAKANASASVSNIVVMKTISSRVSRRIGTRVGTRVIGRLGVRLAAKVAGKMGARIAAKAATGFVPILGAAVSGGLNYWFLQSIAESAKEYYANPIEISDLSKKR